MSRNEPVPMVQAVADGFGDDGLRRDARELLFEPDFESQHERLALFLAHGTALVGRSAADRLLNRVEKRLVNLWPASRLDELMPWAWAARRSTDRLAA